MKTRAPPLPHRLLRLKLKKILEMKALERPETGRKGGEGE